MGPGASSSPAQIGPHSAAPTGLYAGPLPTLVAMFPYIGVEFMVYETLKRQLELQSGAAAGTVTMLLCGALSGACGQASAHPLDVVRRRMQIQGIKSAMATDEVAPPPSPAPPSCSAKLLPPP